MANATRSQLYIDGEFVDGSGGEFDVVNPATEEVINQAPQATASDVDDAIAAARRAFDSWSRTSPAERGAVLARAADLLEQRTQEYADLAIDEVGVTPTTARAVHVGVSLRRLRRYADVAFESRDVPFLPNVVPSSPFGPGALVGGVAARRPVGVVGALAPYNFPLGTSIGKLAPAIAAGNTVVLKPPPQDPTAVLRFAHILEEAGLPAGVVNIVSDSGSAVGEAMVDSPDVDLISFTGSSAVGRKIAEAGGRTLKRLFLELGGKGAGLVLADADLDVAMPALTSTWAFQSGQGCVLPTRVIVHRSRYDELIEQMMKTASSLVVGNPRAEGTVLGPVISDRQRAHVEGLVSSVVEEGGEILAGGSRPDVERGYFVAPTLVSAKPGMRVWQEEAFGPVVAVTTFDDIEEGIALANDTEYGLHNYVFSSDNAAAYQTAARLASGYVSINCAHQHPEAPFGGFKQSGIGRDGGAYSLDAYTEAQSVVWV